jgi:hypothetical protein
MKTKAKNRNESKRIKILGRIYKSLNHSMLSANAVVPNAWLKERKLSFEKSGAGFCSGRIHYRTSKEFIRELESVGFLRSPFKKNDKMNSSHSCFGKGAMLFPLRNSHNEVVNFYSIGLQNGETEYLNEEGIYPTYPSLKTKRLFIVNAILEAATLLESPILKEHDSIMALRDGTYLPQHREVLDRIAGNLDEIIFLGKERIKTTV